MLRHLHGVLAVAVHAQRQRLDALEEDPRVIGRDGRAEVAQGHGEHAELVREGRETLGEIVAPAKTAVGGVRGVKDGVSAGSPVEAALVDADAADARAVAADPLRERRDDDVGAVLEGLGEVRRGERRVDDERDVLLVADRGDGLEVADLQSGVGHGLAEQRARLVVDGGAEVLGVLGVHELHRDAHRGEDVVELRVGSAIQLAGRDDVVARLRKGDDGIEARGGAGRDGDRGEGVAALELRDAGLQDVRGGVTDAGINVAELLEREQVGGVLGVLELWVSE